MQTVLSRPAVSSSVSGLQRKELASVHNRPAASAIAPRPRGATLIPAAYPNSFGPFGQDPWSSSRPDSRSSTPRSNPNIGRTSRPRPTIRMNDPWANFSSPSSSPTAAGAVRDFDGRYGNESTSANQKPNGQQQQQPQEARQQEAAKESSSSSSSAPSSSTTSTTPSTQPQQAHASEPEPTFEELLAELSPEEQKNVRLFQECSKSVVNVSTTIDMSRLFPLNMLAMPRGVGSGFVWDREGHVITNAHVIRGAESVSVTLNDQTVAKAKVIGKDSEKDVAVLKLELTPEQKAKLTPVTLGSSTRLLVGQKVVAIGNPFSLDTSCSQGIVSGLGREINAPPSMNGYAPIPISGVIQTDAAINPGNSGGPLLDARGRVVGINTAIASVTGGSSGVGFAIPIDAVKGLVAQILTHGRTLRPALGISLAPPSFLRQIGGSRGPEGVLVLGVRAGGPAEVAGVQPTRREVWGQTVLGDVITAVNSKKVKSQKDLFAALDACRVGQTVELALIRGSVERTVKVQLADREQLSAFE